MATITDALPPPKCCDNCKSERVRLHRYTRRRRPKYVCYKCKASVYCHKDSNIPLGYMATSKTRYLRAKAHESFDPLWRTGLITRNQAYEWLARQMSVPAEQAHIGRLGDDALTRLAGKAERYYRKLVARTKKKEAVQNATDRRQRTFAASRRNGTKW